MTIYQLECFIAVAEELNFSAAAQRLFTTQPAVTYQINTLEKETGLTCSTAPPGAPSSPPPASPFTWTWCR